MTNKEKVYQEYEIYLDYYDTEIHMDMFPSRRFEEASKLRHKDLAYEIESEIYE